MNESRPEVLLKHYLKKLKLPTILREYQAMAAVCTKERCDYSSFLLRLVERESLDRQKRAAERRGKNARFPVIKTLDTFDDMKCCFDEIRFPPLCHSNFTGENGISPLRLRNAVGLAAYRIIEGKRRPAKKDRHS